MTKKKRKTEIPTSELKILKKYEVEIPLKELRIVKKAEKRKKRLKT